MRLIPTTLLLLSSTLLLSAQTPDSFGVRILLGVGDDQPVRWDGSVSASGASITRIEPWRFETSDSISGTEWKVSTHPIKLFLGGIFVPNRGERTSTVVANGVVIQLARAHDDSQLNVKTAQGDFPVRLGDIPFGTAKNFIGGRVTVDRVPPATQITNTPDEQDYPSAAVDGKGDVWVAYVEFRHAKDHNRLRADMTAPPADLDQYHTPTGGDQILVRRYSAGSWSAPIEITAPGLDLYRPSIAIDGKGRPWVFWSQSKSGNFDVWARAIENGKPGTTVQISHEPGSDIDPASAVDSSGNIWVAWQGWREGRAAIFAAHQGGNSFSRPERVSNSTANEWNPTIAADAKGRVSVAWDSYRNGNYDVFFRTHSGSSWGREVAAAATPRYEAYPSVAYDGAGRLWVAYEESGAGWGKDYGAYKIAGTALYQGRVIRLRGFEPNGRVVETSADIGASLIGMAPDPFSRWGVQNDAEDLDNHEAALHRKNNREAEGLPAALNSYPRLHVDASGRIWLAFRSANPIWWAPMGTTWFEYLTSYDGSKWTSPIFLTHSDNLLDNRPAVVSIKPGTAIVVGSSDSRSQYQLAGKYVVEYPEQAIAGLTGRKSTNPPGTTVPIYMDVTIPNDPYNNDLWANEVSLGPGSQPAVVDARRPVSAPAPRDAVEAAAVVRLRDYRVSGNGGAELRIVRGEFHRHSEISFDGGTDGAILDQYRYIMDASSLDWAGCCDHDNGMGREYTWWLTQKLTDIFYSPGHYAGIFSYERSVSYPEGHRNVLFATRGIRTLPRLPITKDSDPGHAPDTQMLYAYLKHFDGIVASHTSGTQMGTDWRDNDPANEPVVEIYQGMRQNYEMPDAPRSNSADDSIGGWRPKGFISNALQKGYKLGFEASSDHISTHLSYSNVLVTDVTREAVLDGFKKRHVYAATDNILADVRSGSHLMGDIFSTDSVPAIQVHLVGTTPFKRVVIVKDNEYVYSKEPGAAQVDFTWRDEAARRGKESYYYVRGEQENGEIVWVSPMWITYR